MCVHKLSLLLLLLLAGWSGGYEVTEMVEGRLEAESVNHYTIDTTGILIVALLTEEGDADLYASTVTKQPDDHDYQLSSCSCGLDLIVMTTEGAESQRVYLSVVGHSRHAKSNYKLAIISPSNDDITQYQVWELDPETGHNTLLVDFNPLQIANDHTLHQLLRQLDSSAGVKGDSNEGVWSSIKDLTEWSFYLIFEALKIMIDILL